MARIRRQRRLVVLWTEPDPRGQTPGGLCAKGLERREAGRFAGRATRQVRACHQSQDRQGPWAYGAAFVTWPRRRGDRIATNSAVGTRQTGDVPPDFRFAPEAPIAKAGF